MNIQKFIENLDHQVIDMKFVEQIEKSYEVSLNEKLKKILSAKPEGEFFEGDDILRLLSHDEIINATHDLSVDFIGLKLIPMLDTGDNDYIVFDVENNCWCKFNIVDATRYKQRQELTEFFANKS